MLLSLKTEAQIQITQSNLPSINDTFRFSVAPLGGTFDFKQTGANFTWDYSDLDLSSQDLYRFQSLGSTPYATLLLSGMPFGAIGYKVADSIGAGQFAFKNLYNFFEKKSNVWRAVGTGFTLSVLPLPAGGIYSDFDEIYQLPLNYNDFDSSTFQVTTPLGNQLFQLGTFKQKGYRLNKVEGWGTITTPYGNNISCLKIKSTVVETDSLKISTPAFNVGFPANRVEYKWLSTTEKIPVLEVVGIEIGGVFTPNQIRYRDRFRAPKPGGNGPLVEFDADKYIGKAGKDTFFFSNSSRPSFGSTYQWSFSPSAGIRYVNGTSASSSTPNVIFDSAGIYSVTLSASNAFGTRDSTAVNMINISKDGNNQSISSISKGQINIYPNPVSGNIHFSNSELINSVVRIYDISGKLLIESILDADLKLNCNALISGQYFLIIRTNDSIFYTQFNKE